MRLGPSNEVQPERSDSQREAAPLLIRQWSTQEELKKGHTQRLLKIPLLIILATLLFALGLVVKVVHPWKSIRIISIDEAVEHWLDLPDRGLYDDQGNKVKLRLWFRTWGRSNGIPILFVHGGPGNAIADYNNGNRRFFDDSIFYVVEIDQRGTGNSQPSVRNAWRNMRYYYNISIDLISQDFELVRKSLGIKQWLVWGGSFGSTIGINYGMRFPDRCLGLILRGIYLDTPTEVESVYSRQAYLDNPKRLAEFDILFQAAVRGIRDSGGNNATALDPYNAEQLLRTYEGLIQKGDQEAIWHWHVFENNLMEDDPKNLLDPDVIDPVVFPQAQSIAFFETRLWLRGSYDDPSNLLERLSNLTSIRIWICQGMHDEVCPPQNAHILVESLRKVNGTVHARFLDGRHEDTDPVLEDCLKRSMREFLHYMG